MIKFNKTEIKKINTLKRKLPVDFENQLNKLLKVLKTRAEYELSDTVYYRPVNEALQNTNKKLYCKSVALSIVQDETNKAQHLLEVSMLHPTMMIEVKRPLASGNKQTIMNFLNNESSLKLLKDDLNQMSEKLKSR